MGGLHWGACHQPRDGQRAQTRSRRAESALFGGSRAKDETRGEQAGNLLHGGWDTHIDAAATVDVSQGVCTDADASLRSKPATKFLFFWGKSYSSAIDILYSSNTFLTSEPDCIVLLPRFLLPPRIDAIRAIHFEWMMKKPPFFIGFENQSKFRDHEHEWHNVWHALSLMRNLRTLHVKLIANMGGLLTSRWRTEESRMFQPVAAVTGPEDFLLLLPWPVDDSGDAALQKLPCRVGRWKFMK